MSKSKTRKTAIILCISIILMLVSAVATMVIQTGGGSITIKELHWETDSGFAMDGWLFIPDGATAENPAPGIVTSHGMYNNKGMQDANFVELARRGYRRCSGSGAAPLRRPGCRCRRDDGPAPGPGSHTGYSACGWAAGGADGGSSDRCRRREPWAARLCRSPSDI